MTPRGIVIARVAPKVGSPYVGYDYADGVALSDAFADYLDGRTYEVLGYYPNVTRYEALLPLLEHAQSQEDRNAFPPT